MFAKITVLIYNEHKIKLNRLRFNPQRKAKTYLGEHHGQICIASKT